MPRPTKVYRIPLKRFARSATNKAGIHYIQPGRSYECVAAPDAEIIEISASSNADAYQKLCEQFDPADDRKIMGKWWLSDFVLCLHNGILIPRGERTLLSREGVK